MLIYKVGNTINNVTQYRAMGEIFGKQNILPREFVFWSDEKFNIGDDVSEHIDYLLENEYGGDLSTVAIAYDNTDVINKILQEMIDANDNKREFIESDFEIESQFDSIVVFDVDDGKSLILVNSLYADLPESITQISISTINSDDLSLIEMIYFYIMNSKEVDSENPEVEGIYHNGDELDVTNQDELNVLKIVFDLLTNKINTFDVEDHLIDADYDETFLDN